MQTLSDFHFYYPVENASELATAPTLVYLPLWIFFFLFAVYFISDLFFFFIFDRSRHYATCQRVSGR